MLSHAGGSKGARRRQQGSSRVSVDDAFEGESTFLANIVDQVCCAGLTEGAH